MASNTNNNDAKAHTHIAWTAKREGRKLKLMRWLEIGAARIEKETGIGHVFIDRMPVGGFTGYVYLSPVGTPPPSPDPQPQRPGESDDEDE